METKNKSGFFENWYIEFFELLIMNVLLDLQINRILLFELVCLCPVTYGSVCFCIDGCGSI